MDGAPRKEESQGERKPIPSYFALLGFQLSKRKHSVIQMRITSAICTLSFISLLNQRKALPNTTKEMKTISSWEFRHLRYIEYLCDNVSTEPFHIPLVKMDFFLSDGVTYYFIIIIFFFGVVTLLSIGCLLFR